MHTHAMYAKTMGIAGEMLCHSHDASNTKNRMQGTRANMPVAMFMGRCLVFCQRPPKKKMVLPSKYWYTQPGLLCDCGVCAFVGRPRESTARS